MEQGHHRLAAVQIQDGDGCRSAGTALKQTQESSLINQFYFLSSITSNAMKTTCSSIRSIQAQAIQANSLTAVDVRNCNPDTTELRINFAIHRTK